MIDEKDKKFMSMYVAKIPEISFCTWQCWQFPLGKPSRKGFQGNSRKPDIDLVITTTPTFKYQ